MYKDLYNGRRLRIGISDVFLIWIRWGWRAERQWSITRFFIFRWNGTEYQIGWFRYVHFR